MGKITLSLSHKLILAFLLMLLPILFAFYLSYYNTKRYLESFIMQDLKVIAGGGEGDLLVFMEMNKRRVTDFASDGFIRDELERLINGGRDGGRALGHYIARNKLVLDSNLSRVDVLSRDGRLVASTSGKDAGKDVSKEEYFLKGRDSAAVVEMARGSGGRPEVAFSAPLHSRKTGKPTGVIAGFVPVAKFSRLLAGELNRELGALSWDVMKGRKTMEMYIVNRDGLMLTKSRFFEEAPLTRKVKTVPVEKCSAERKEMAGFYRDYRDVEVMGASMCLPSMRWTLLAEIDSDEALEPIAAMQTYLLAVFAAVIITIIGFVVYISRGLIRPLKGLSLAAKDIAGGNYDVSVPIASGDEIGSLALSFDVMAGRIKERTNALKESEGRLRAILDHTTSVIFMKDREGRYMLVNRKFETLFNVTGREMIGRSDYDIMPLDVADRLRANDRLAIESDRPLEMEEKISIGNEIRYYIVVKFAMLDEHRFPYAVCGVATDITELKRSHEALVKSEASLANAQRMAHIGNWDWDIARDDLSWSEEMYGIFGISRDMFAGNYESFLQCVHPADRAFVKNSVNDALSNERPYSIDYRIIRRDGETRMVHEQAEFVRGAGGHGVIMSGTLQDITDRKRAEDEVRSLNVELEKRVVARTHELQHANRELEAFSYSVAHDLRSPLRIIDGFSNALLEDYGDRLDEHGRDYLRRVREASQRMGALIDDLLGLARVIRADLRREPVDLSAMAAAVASELKKADPGRRVELSVAPGLKADGDARLLRVALDNLLGNAWKFTSKKESARVEFGTLGPDADKDGGRTVFFVHDNGAGFNMKYVDRLFGAFQRLHSITEFAGTGIGLATVQRIVHRHGGRVWAEGEEGGGATFYFTL